MNLASVSAPASTASPVIIIDDPGVNGTLPMVIKGFTLIDTENNTPIRKLVPNDNIGASDSLSIQADVDHSNFNYGSVQFNFGPKNGDNTIDTEENLEPYTSFGDNTIDRVENVEPYALNGDKRGNYRPVPGLNVPGTYTIKATPYSGHKATGTAGTPLELTFTVRETY